MGIWNKRPDAPEPDGGHTDRLREIAAEKAEAATRFSSAIAAAGEAMTALFDADRAFLAEHRQRYGSEAHSASRLMHQFRGSLLGELELSAPDLLRHLNQPRQSRAKAQTIATLIARQVENDLSSLPAEKEPAQ
ncbi:hypothetical protein K3172_13350 [Qipengyuania sp. 6B39]|uniref:hypothetical protein n=1 Tax=Qipengyuania proteolytica TaxID=2867239 RepID=UPI001C89A78C|nr:hypothetical protein [Qipengyuania proteolytica]MBX7496844.1 hypothetical protein [Qipengyuania proteolytica]